MSVKILGQSISKGKKQIRKFGLGGDAFQPLRHIGDDRIAEAARALGISSINKPEEVSRVVNWRPAPPPPPAPEPEPAPPPEPATVDPSFASDSNNSEVTPEPETQGMTPAEYDYQKAIDLANIDKEIENIRTQSANYIADVQGRSAVRVGELGLEGTKYSANRSKEATTYVADRQKEATLGAENIRAKGALDLQVIVNAGLKDVETIRGTTAKDVATIEGQFDVQGEEIRGKAARDVARLDKDKGIYGSLISAFNFT